MAVAAISHALVNPISPAAIVEAAELKKEENSGDRKVGK